MKRNRHFGVVIVVAAVCGLLHAGDTKRQGLGEEGAQGCATEVASLGALATNEIAAVATTNATVLTEGVEKLLKARSLKYEIEKDGDVSLTFGLPNKRTQTAYIESKLGNLDGYKTMLVYSPAYRGTLTKPMLLELLVSYHDIGFWFVQTNGVQGNEAALFAVQAPVNITAQNLETVLQWVAEVADGMEYKWTDADVL